MMSSGPHIQSGESAITTSEPAPWPETALARGALEIVQALQQAGHQACFVGGAVRNWLLGLPLKDVDIATSAHPEQVSVIFAAARSVGAHFGVQLVQRGEISYEIATFRTEGS